MRERSKFLGSMVGGAVGDALGYPIEFMSAEEIGKKFGAGGITDYILHNGVAEISDDTQMSLFTAAGLLLGLTRGMLRGFLAEPFEYVDYTYRDWYRTQTSPYPIPKGERYSWLANVKELYHCRAPGNTCLSALATGGRGTIERPINGSKGCGGMMRVAPVGLFYCDTNCSIKASDFAAARTAAVTHGHPLGYIPAAMLAHIIRRIVEQGEQIEAATLHALSSAEPYFRDELQRERQKTLIERALTLAVKGGDDLRNIQALGEGWVAEETLAIAVYCAVRYANDFERGVCAAVNHGGDSDSTGAVAGNILGAALGIDAIPKKFTQPLELCGVIKEIANDLYLCGSMEEEAFRDSIWTKKYITFEYRPGETL